MPAYGMVRTKQEDSIQFIHRVDFFLTILFLLLWVCPATSGSDQPPSDFVYTNDTAIYTKGVPIPVNQPARTGSAGTTYTVSPALPAGLSLNPGTGVISGTPTTATPTGAYAVTASDAAGSRFATLFITVLAATPVQPLPNLGQQITPLAPEHSRFEPLNPELPDMPGWLAGQAVTTVVSPDGKTLLVLTSGYNRVYEATGFKWPDSKEYVFIYDISKYTPVKKQVVQIPNTYNGIVFDPSGKAFYVSGGRGDFPFDKLGKVTGAGEGDNVHVFTLNAGTWKEESELLLGHHAGVGLYAPDDGMVPINSQVFVQPCAAGVDISKDGKTLVVANYYNDSITVFNGGLGNWSKGMELDLRPGKSNAAQAGIPGGEYPFWVVVKGSGPGATAYVSSIRDREIVVVNLGGAPAVTARIPVKGQPTKMILNGSQSLLYAVEDQSDTIDVIDTANNAILETIPAIAPASAIPASLAQYRGANPNSLTLSPDETQLYVTNGNLNSVVVVALTGANRGDQVVGLIPTGWYPTSISFSADGNWVYVVNGKSPTGPNPRMCYSSAPASVHKNCFLANQYNPQLIKAGFQSFPRPDSAQLAMLTAQVVVNNRFSSTEGDKDAAIMAAVRKGVQHVIFIIKENRTYDQVLGDLEIGNGDPALAEFGQALTPNLHVLARTFVTLDNFLDSAETSNDGWPWTTSARAPEVIERQFPVAYGGRGLSLDSEGVNRNVNVAIPTLARRRAADPLTPDDPDVLPGQTNVAAPDGPDNEINTGYLWDSALRANLTVRSYGFFVDTTLYPVRPPKGSGVKPIPLDRNPFATHTTVAFSSSASLTPYTDPYYRGFDNQFPDYYRYTEWARDFDANYAQGQLPALSLVRLMHDHTGNFADAIDGVNTPELQQADNDYAVGLLVQKIANSIYASNTLIFVVEDDSQDAGDHVDSHRSVAFVAGAYVKQKTLVSSPYNTISLVRTIEEVLGLPPMNLNDALARPMADIFNTTPSSWSFSAAPSAMLYGTALPLPAKPVGLIVPRPTHSAAYWARVTKGMDFTSEDRMDFADYNRILWKGLMGNQPYPATASGIDLRQNRGELLAGYQRSRRNKATDEQSASKRADSSVR